MHYLQAVKGIVILLLGYCSYTDLKDNRVYNRIVMPILILQMVYMVGTYGWTGLIQCVLGITTVLPLYLLFTLGMLGAGDVKLLMALSAGLGPIISIRLMTYSLIAGGVMAVIVMLWRKILICRLKRLWNYCMSTVLTGKLDQYNDGGLCQDGQMPLVPAITIGFILVVVVV